jgi:hypothetical protein
MRARGQGSKFAAGSGRSPEIALPTRMWVTPNCTAISSSAELLGLAAEASCKGDRQ